MVQVLDNWTPRILLKDSVRMANTEDLGAVLSGSAQFA